MHREQFQDVVIKVVTTQDSSIAIATYYGQDFIESSGTARRHPDDRSKPSIGENLAIGRALENLGLKLQKRANGIVKQNDDNAARKATQQVEAVKPSRKKKVKGCGGNCGD